MSLPNPNYEGELPAEYTKQRLSTTVKRTHK